MLAVPSCCSLVCCTVFCERRLRPSPAECWKTHIDKQLDCCCRICCESEHNSQSNRPTGYRYLKRVLLLLFSFFLLLLFSFLLLSVSYNNSHSCVWLVKKKKTEGTALMIVNQCGFQLISLITIVILRCAKF
jgi:hypothetical protein